MSFLHLRYNLVYTGIRKLFHSPAFLTNQVFVMLIVKRFFKLSNIIAKLVFDHQFTIQQQINRIIKRCTAHPIILVLHKHIERLYIEMS